MAEKLPVKVLSRTWQMLLKGIPEVQSAPRPVSAGEMVLIRIAHAATLPTLDEALKMLDDVPPSGGGGGGSRSSGQSSGNGGASADSHARISGQSGGGAPVMRLVDRPAPQPQVEQVPVHSLADIAALATQNRDPAFKVAVKSFVRLVRVEPGKLEISLTDNAPRDLPNQIGDRLKRWTGRNWLVALSREKGSATLDEEENERREGQLNDARADPAVAAILARFPGSRIIDIRLADGPDMNDDDMPAPAPDPGLDSDDDDL